MPQPNPLLRAARERMPSRRAAGTHMSREELAELVALWIAEHDGNGRDVAFDANHLGKLERGVVRRPRALYVAALCAVLNATEAELGFGPEPDTTRAPTAGWDRDSIAVTIETITRDDLATSRRQALVAVALAGAALTQPLQHWLDTLPDPGPADPGEAFTPLEVDVLEGLVEQFHAWGAGGVGVLARKAVVAQLAELGERLRTAPKGVLTTRATLAAARLAKTAASMSANAGAQHAAQRYYALAIRLAKVAGDDALAAVSLAALGRQSYDLHRPADGLEVVQLAQFGTRRTATPRLRAMLATREAWAYAQRGEVQAFHRTIGLAQDHFAEATEPEPCRWVRSFDAAELHGVIGARFRDLARFEPRQARHAQDHIARALELRDPGRVRNRVFDLIGLARVCLITDEPARAGDLVSEALPLASRWIPGRVGVRLVDFQRESARFRSVPAIRNVHDAIQSLVADGMSN